MDGFLRAQGIRFVEAACQTHLCPPADFRFGRRTTAASLRMEGHGARRFRSMSDDDERKRAAVQDLVGAGGDLMALVRPWGNPKAQEILSLVQADYVDELNRALANGQAHPYGIDADAFLRQYEAIGEAKKAL